MSAPLLAWTSRTLTAITALAACALAAPAVDVDPALPAYSPVSGLSGNLNSIGSDSLNNLMTYWAEGFMDLYPNVNVQVEGKGSSTAPPGLSSGAAQIGPMSREMKKEEIDTFEKKYGYKPTAIKVALDALGVFVHKDNPIKQLTLEQVDGIFSSTFKHGGRNIASWSDLGLAGWEGKAISLYGRNSASGTYGYFKEFALKKGDFKPTVKEQPGSSSVIQGVASDPTAIGYSGIGYLTSDVRAVPLGVKADQVFEPSVENAASGKYPLARFLLIYINKKPGQPADPVVAEFVKYICSKAGQEVVVKDGYFPLLGATAAEMAALVK